MSLLGQVMNKAIGKAINVELATAGPDFIRITSAIEKKYKLEALERVRAEFEGCRLFKEADMKQINKIVITHMSHESGGDPNAHYSVEALNAAGAKVKGGHVQVDPRKQTMAK